MISSLSLNNISKCYRYNVRNFGNTLCSVFFLWKINLFLHNDLFTHNFLRNEIAINFAALNGSKGISCSTSPSVQSLFYYSPPTPLLLSCVCGVPTHTPCLCSVASSAHTHAHLGFCVSSSSPIQRCSLV